MGSLSALSFSLIIISLILMLVPPLIWGVVNYQKVKKGEQSFKLQRAHKWSWIICEPSGILVLILAFVVVL